MLQKVSVSVGMISLACILISCSTASPQATLEPTKAPATETPAPTVVPTLNLPVEELNEQLLEAVRNDDAEQLSLLIVSGADLEAKEHLSGATPLILAAYRGDVAVIETLLSAGANVNSADRAGMTPLMFAAQLGHTAVIPILLKAGAELDTLSTSHYDQNALHFAAQKGHPEIVEALLKAGANVDALENTHSTALMYAAYWGHTKVVEILLVHGADTTIVDNGKQTAAYWAEKRGFPELAQLIETTQQTGK